MEKAVTSATSAGRGSMQLQLQQQKLQEQQIGRRSLAHTYDSLAYEGRMATIRELQTNEDSEENGTTSKGRNPCRSTLLESF